MHNDLSDDNEGLIESNRIVHFCDSTVHVGLSDDMALSNLLWFKAQPETIQCRLPGHSEYSCILRDFYLVKSTGLEADSQQWLVCAPFSEMGTTARQQAIQLLVQLVLLLDSVSPSASRPHKNLAMRLEPQWETLIRRRAHTVASSVRRCKSRKPSPNSHSNLVILNGMCR